MKRAFRILLLLILIVPVVALAQTTTYEVKQGTVVSTYDNKLVVKMSTGETKEVTIPEGFKFMVDGKEVGLADLQPGTVLTATVATTTKPETVMTTMIRNGEVVKVVGSQIWIRTQGKVKAFSIPPGFKFAVDGKMVPISELRPGYKLTAEIVYKSESTVTEKSAQIAGSAPAPPPAVEPAPAEAPAVAEVAPPPAELPKTGSTLPLVALLGALLTLAGFALSRAAK